MVLGRWGEIGPNLGSTMRSTCQDHCNCLFNLLRHIGNGLGHCFVCVSPCNRQQHCMILWWVGWVKLGGTMRSTWQYHCNCLYNLVQNFGNVLGHCIGHVSPCNMQCCCMILCWVGGWTWVVPWGGHINITATVYTTCSSTLAVCYGIVLFMFHCTPLNPAVWFECRAQVLYTNKEIQYLLQFSSVGWEWGT